MECSERWSSCLSTGKKKEKILNPGDEARGKRNAIRLQEAYTVETVVVADSDMVQYHGAEAAQRFLLTVMNMVRSPEVNPQEEGGRERQNRTDIKSVCLSFPCYFCSHCLFQVYNMFHHRSLGIRINIRVTKLVLLHSRPVSFLLPVSGSLQIRIIPTEWWWTGPDHMFSLHESGRLAHQEKDETFVIWKYSVIWKFLVIKQHKIQHTHIFSSDFILTKNLLLFIINVSVRISLLYPTVFLLKLWVVPCSKYSPMPTNFLFTTPNNGGYLTFSGTTTTYTDFFFSPAWFLLACQGQNELTNTWISTQISTKKDKI